MKLNVSVSMVQTDFPPALLWTLNNKRYLWILLSENDDFNVAMGEWKNKKKRGFRVSTGVQPFVFKLS